MLVEGRPFSANSLRSLIDRSVLTFLCKTSNSVACFPILAWSYSFSCSKRSSAYRQRRGRKHSRSSILPVRNLNRVKFKFPSDSLDDLHSFEGFNSDPGFELGFVSPLFSFHFSLFRFGSETATVHHNHNSAPGPKSGILLKGFPES